MDEEGMDGIVEEDVPVRVGRDTVLLRFCMFSETRQFKRVLRVRLTDPQKLFFYYSLILEEEEFRILKESQHLLVEFNDFPEMVRALLRECCNTSDSYFAEFESSSDEGMFRVIERKAYRNLEHLSLRVAAGDDRVVKEHLAEELSVSQKEVSSLRGKLSRVESLLDETRRSVGLAEKEQNEMKSELISVERRKDAERAEAVAAEKESWMATVENVRNELLIRVKETEKKLIIVEEEKMRIIDEYKRRVDELSITKGELDGRTRELSGSLRVAEEENTRLRNEVDELGSKLLTSTRRASEVEQSWTTERIRSASLDQQVNDQEKTMSTLRSLLDRSEGERSAIEDTLQSSRKECGGMERKLRAAIDEIGKGNNMLRRLRGQVKGLKAKLRVKVEVAVRQEELLKERDDERRGIEKDVEGIRDTLQDERVEKEKLKGQLEETTQQLEESRRIITKNESAIQFLNRQLNEASTSHTPALFSPPSRSVNTTWESGYKRPVAYEDVVAKYEEVENEEVQESSGGLFDSYLQ